MLAGLSPMAYTPSPMVVRAPTRAVAPVMAETLDDLKALAPKLNPVVGYYNPLGIGEPGFEDISISTLPESSRSTIAWFRQAEIKHGRVAMAAFVGFIVGENKIHFPWAIQGGPSPITYEDIANAGGAAAQWDAVPTLGKLQIILAIGALEIWGEAAGTHYMAPGGKPGVYPTFEPIRKELGQPPLDLYDPFGFSKNRTPEQKERGLLVEINNGRAAMLGIMGFVSAATVEGSVPALTGKIAPYSGEVMAPFAAGDTSLPFVEEMLKYPHFPLTSFW
jgi:hypothetical protein